MKQLTDKQFEEIYDQYFDELYVVAYSYTTNKFDAEDIVQEVFVKFYRARKTFADNKSIKYYLIRMTINRSIDYIRHIKNSKTLIADEYVNSFPDTLNSDSSKNEEIYMCVCSLKSDYKTIIMLYYYDNYSIKEIASILKISESNVKVRLNRARTKLKEIISERRDKDGI